MNTTAMLLTLGITLTALGLYVLLSPRVGEPLYHGELFHPYKYPRGNYQLQSLEGIAKEDVFFAGPEGKKLHGWFFRAPKATKTILVNHGNTGNVGDLETLLSLLLRSGASVFAFDYQGYGRSQGSPSVAGICADSVAAYEYLVNKEGIPPQTLVVYGESLGSAVSCQLVANRPCAGLILQSAFSSLTKIAYADVPVLSVYPQFLFPPPFFNSLWVLKNQKHPPLLIFHGDKDPEVPISHAKELFAYALEPKTLVVLPHTLHEDITKEDSDLFVNSVRKYLSSLDNTQAIAAPAEQPSLLAAAQR